MESFINASRSRGLLLARAGYPAHQEAIIDHRDSWFAGEVVGDVEGVDLGDGISTSSGNPEAWNIFSFHSCCATDWVISFVTLGAKRM